MDETSILVELLLLIAVAAAGVAIFERVRLPPIAGFLVAGAIFGPGGLGVVEDSERVRQLAEFGVVFLLFEIGLEMPVDLLRRLWRVVLAAGALQVAGTISCIAALALTLGIPGPSAVLVGGLVAMSSTALVVRLLAARGQVDAPHGHLCIGILLFQDLCIVPMLLAVPILAGSDSAPLWTVIRALARGTLILALLIFTARYLLPRILEWAVRIRSTDLLSLVAFLLVLGFAVAAELLGLTLAVGAFTAGLLLGSSPYAHQLFAEVAPVRGVLLGVFFTAVGMLFEPLSALALWPMVTAWVAAVVLVKTALIISIVGFILRRGLRLAILTGLGLAQTGEFSFVLGEAGREAGLLDPDLYQVMVAGSILTLIATPLLFRAAPRLASGLARVSERLGHDGAPPVAHPVSPPDGHAVILGFGLAGKTIARVLAACDIPYVILDANPVSVAEARSRGEPILFGDSTRPAILEHLRVARARMVAVAISDPVGTRRTVAMVRSLSPHTRIVARTRYVAHVDALSQCGADVVVIEEFEATLDMLRAALRAFGFPTESIARFSEQMRQEGYEVMRAPAALALDPWLAELLSEVGTEWIEVPHGPAAGQSLEDLRIRARTGASIIAVERGAQTTANPDAGFILEAGDRLLAYGDARNLRRLERLLRRDEPSASMGNAG